ncbi:type IV secretion system DNA-binding domain-containing protein [Burkholderia vietnamiensis]|nr:type IV secretion system DNA-binding domain-containing protein [Burkholderia vietnamiensis]
MPPVIPPTQTRRNVSGAISLAVTTTFGVAAGSLALLWRDLPLSPRPDMGLLQHFGYWAACSAHALMPHILIERCATYGNYLSALVANGGAWGLGLRLAVSASLALASGGYVLRRGLIPSDALMHSRGLRLLKGRDAIRRAKKTCAGEIKRASKLANRGRDLMFSPEICFAPERWARHIMVVGAVGAGKTVFLTQLLAQILARKDRVLLFDIKRDFTMYFKHAIIIAATDSRSWAWDIARDVATRQAAQQFAKQLIEDSKDPFWSAAARALLVGFIVMLVAEKKEDWGFPELADVLQNTPESDLPAIMKEYSPEAMEIVAEAKGRDAAANPNQAAKSIKMTMQTYCSAIYDLATAWKDEPPDPNDPEGKPKRRPRFSAVEWMMNPDTRHRQVILQGDKTVEPLTRAYISQIFSIVSSRIGALPEARTVPPRTDGKSNAIWLFCDELPALGKIEAFDAAITLGRSKDVRWVAGLQSIEQLHEIYGKEKASSWVANMGTIVVGRVAPGATATQVKDMVGKKEVERPNWSASGGANGQGWTFMTSRDEMSVIYESELSEDLGPQTVRDAGFLRKCYEALWPFATPREKTVIRMLVLGLGDALMMDWPIVELRKRRRAFVQAAWVDERPKARLLSQGEGEGGFQNDPDGDANDIPEDELVREGFRSDITDEEYNALMKHTTDYALGLAHAVLASGGTLPNSPEPAARGFIAPGVDVGGNVAGLVSPERRAEMERDAARVRIHDTLRDRVAGLTAAPARAIGLADGPRAATYAPTTAAQINTLTVDRTLRPGLDGRDDDLSETAHATHLAAEAIGHEAHLDAGQTEHLGAAMLALDIVDSLKSDDGAMPRSAGAAAQRSRAAGLQPLATRR